MTDSTSWQEFCLLYYDQARILAKGHLNKIKSTFSHWDSRIDEDVICEDAVMEALQKAFVKYDPSRGASLKTFLSRVVHNDLVDELDREIKALSTLGEASLAQEADYSVKDIIPQIPEKAMDGLKEKLRAAILKLSPIDQIILGFFLEDPRTFVERSSATLGVTPGFVSVHKKRALIKLPALMNMTSDDYFDLYEDHTFAGAKSKCRTKPTTTILVNPVYPQFDLDGTVQRLFAAIDSASKENL